MENTTQKNVRYKLLLMLFSLFLALGVSAQDVLLTQGFNNAGAMPAGWSKTLVSGTDAITFETVSTYPGGFSPYEGSHMVKFASFSYSSAVNRLHATTPISTVGKANISVQFAWLESTGYATDYDNVKVQWSTDGTTWNDGGIYNRPGSSDQWTIKTDVLPAGAENQPSIFIGFLFTSEYGNNCYFDDVIVTGTSTGPPPVTINIGAGTLTASYPFYTVYEDSKTQIIYDAAEILAAGGLPGEITSIGFNVSSFNTMPMNGFNIQLQNYSGSTLSGFVQTGWTTVYSGSYTITSTGWHVFNFSTPFDWDGSSNVLMNICFDNDDWDGNSPVFATANAGKTWHQHDDGATGCDFAVGSAQANRPNIQMTIQPNAILPTGIVQGYITNAYGVPVPDATVFAQGDNGNFTTTSGPNGAYIIEDISIGTYTMGATKEGYNVTTVPGVVVYMGMTTYQNISLTQPSMAITPNPYSVTLNPNELLDGAFSIVNNGNGPLQWAAEVVYTEPDNAQAVVVNAPAFDFTTLTQTESFGEGSTIPGGNGEALNSRDLMMCPDGSKFGNPPVGSDDGYTSTTSAGYKCFQQFVGATGAFKTITFWAIFTATPPATMDFNIDILAPGATPGAVVTSLTATIPAVPTGVMVIGYPTYVFTVEVPSTNMVDGWISVQSTTASPTFYWLNTMSGTGTALQQSGTTYTTLPDKLAMCLSGGAGGWLTLGEYEGTVNAYSNLSLPAYFSAEGTEAGEVYTADVIFTSTPNVGTITVPVTMVIAGPPLNMPEDFTAVLSNPITGQVNLSWTLSPSSGYVNTIVKRDGVVVGTTTGTTFTNILPGYGVYNYTVQAVYDAGASVQAGPVEVEWPNPTMFVDPTYIYDEVWVNHQAVQTVTIRNTGQGTLAFSFPDWVTSDDEGVRAPLAYCTASGGCDEYISRVQFGTIDNSSSCGNYQNFTSISTDLEIGETYPITVTNPNPYSTDIVGIYIDWNQNELFTDAGEFITTTSSGGGASFTANIVVPDYAIPGPTRMRVRLQFGGTLSPCGTTSYGEVEDYTVNVGMPGFIVSVVPAAGQIPQGGNKVITITWDATGFDPGMSYFEELVVVSNDINNPSATILNEMFVYEPAQFAGTVTDIVTGEPLNGVIVTANPMGEFTTLTYDDGTAESGWGINPGYDALLGNYYPVSLSGTINSMDLHFIPPYGGDMTTPLTIEFFDNNRNLIGVSSSFTVTAPGWYTVTVPEIEFNGPFYAMVRWNMITGVTRYLSWDTDGPSAASGLGYIMEADVWSNTDLGAGVFILRANVFATDIPDMIVLDPTQPMPSVKKNIPASVSLVEGNFNAGRISQNTNRNLRAESFQTITDDSGEYQLYVDAGIYNVSFEKTGYQTYIEYDTTALVGMVTPLDAQLREESYPPSFVYAEVNDDDTEVLVTWGDGMGPYEIIYDDGSAENFAAWALPGNMNAVKFTPAEYPATIIGGKIFVGDGSFPNNNTGFLGVSFGAMVMDDDGTDGMPGTVLDSIAVTVNNYGWVSFTGLDAEITDGNFYLVMVQGTLSPNTAPIGVDQTTPTSYRSYSRNVVAGMGWGLSPYQDFMMRAVVYGSPNPTDELLADNSAVKLSPMKQRGLISQSPPMAASGGYEGTGIFKAALDFEDNSRAVTGYRVVRYSGFDPDNSPATGTASLLVNNTQDNEYTDTQWAGLAAGWYAYGVAARYPEGNVSDTIISNIVGHHIDAQVTINLSLTTGTSPAGAYVTMVGLDYPYEVYSATFPEDGQVIFPEVWYGHYDVLAKKVGFDDYALSVNIQGDRVINIILAERKYKPRNLYVDALTLVATWDEPLAISVLEDFEGTTFPPEGWQALTQNTTGWYATTNGSSSSFAIPPHTKYAVTNDDADNGTGCCDYLITPEMNWTDLPSYRLNFASYYDGSFEQSAYVEISTDEGATWTVIHSLVPSPGVWQDLEIDLAPYSGATGLSSVWLAFHADDNGAWASGWAVDDVQIASGGVPLQGYGVFLDGTLVGNTDVRTYTYQYLNYGQEYLAGVAGLYSSGYSELDTYLFRSLYLIPPTDLAGFSPYKTDYVNLTWLAPSVTPTDGNQDILPVINAQPSADLSVSTSYRPFPQTTVPLASSRDILFDNGPLVNSPGTGSGGADESILQLDLGMGTYGSGMQQDAGNSVADDFTVTGNWNIESFEFFGYQTGSTTTSSMTAVFYRIWDGDPTAGGTVIYGDLTTNKLVSTDWTNIYRNDDGPGGLTNRPIMRMVASAEGLTLPEGDYWVEWTSLGTVASGPWVPAVTIQGQTTTGNALQNQSGTWIALVDVGPQGMPFIINGSGGGPSISNLLGYNIYRDNGMIAYVEKPTLEYTDLNLEPGLYDYHITAVYDLTPYGYAGQTGESMIEGPIEVQVSYGYDLPFVEEFSTGLFETNKWTTNGENWIIAGQEGNPAPSAMFTYTPDQSDYALSLSSYWINGVGYVDAKFYLDFDLKLDDNTATGEEQLMVEVYNGSSWVPSVTYTAEGDENWDRKHLDITGSARDRVFRVRFTAKGVNSLDIINWQVDNIHIYAQCDGPTNLTVADSVNFGMFLNWTAPETPGPGPSGWLAWDDGVNAANGIGLTSGGTFSVASRFTPAQLATYAGTTLTKVKFFPFNATGSTFVLKVWTGANASQLVSSQPVTITSDVWNEFTLTTPVPVTGTTEIWFGYTVTHAAGQNPAGVDAGPAVAGYGDMISTDGTTWEAMSSFGPDFNINWNLQAFVETLDGVVATPLQPIADMSTYGSDKQISKRGSNVINPFASTNSSYKGTTELLGYNIYRDGEFIATTPELTYIDDYDGFVIGNTYCYIVTAVYDQCESPMENEVCEVWTSINEITASAINVYPNPSNSVVNIELTDNISEMVIYNFVGQVVFEQVITKDKNIAVNVRNYESGAYLIKFITRSGESFSKKVVVTK